jgi:hypothetical protein
MGDRQTRCRPVGGPCRGVGIVLALAVLAVSPILGACGDGDTDSATTQSVKGAKPGDTFTVATLDQAISGCAISGERVVWLQATGTAAIEVHVKDLATGEEKTLSSNALGSPAIDGDLVVWVSPGAAGGAQDADGAGNATDIAGCDLTTGEGLSICTAAGDQFRPRVSGGTVVWEDGRAGSGTGSDIYGWKLADRSEIPVCTDAGSQWGPDIDGDLVVWASFDPASPAGTAEGSSPPPGIYGRRLAGDEPVTITSGTGVAVEYPVVSGDLVLWKDVSDTPSLLGHDLAADKDVTVQSPWLAGLDSGSGTAPFACADGLVAFTTNDLEAMKPLGPLQVKDLASGETWTAGEACGSPSVSGDLVVWCEMDPESVRHVVAVKGMWIDR